MEDELKTKEDEIRAFKKEFIDVAIFMSGVFIVWTVLAVIALIHFW